jgi:hypothetical protein
MADEGAAVVAEAPLVDVSSPESTDTESSQSTEQQVTDKLDGRQQPDALKKHIGELRRRAEEITDPVAKKAELDRIKFLYDTSGKGSAYEKVYPTVREARETKALVDSVGGKDGLIQMQTTLSELAEIDRALESGDPSVIERMWKEAPEGMVKLAPMIFANLEKTNPEAYAKAVTPHAVRFFDSAGFPEAFDSMVQAYQKGDKATGDRLSAEMARWFSAQRTQTKQEPKIDPETERLRKELETRDSKQSQQEIDRAYNSVVEHAKPVIEKYVKAQTAKLGLNATQIAKLGRIAWDTLQSERNADPTYKTVATAKSRQGMDAAATYIKSETDSRAEDVVRRTVQEFYGHQLKNGAVAAKPNVTATPITNGVTKGKEPTAGEIDYGPKGIQAAKKAGFKDIGDMILAGKAPLKAGGIRMWR